MGETNWLTGVVGDGFSRSMVPEWSSRFWNDVPMGQYVPSSPHFHLLFLLLGETNAN